MKRASIAAAILLVLCAVFGSADTLRQNFVNPPVSAKPWVYWFWLNGNITEQSIKADLQSMAKAGIGGVLIMEVDQGAPVGKVDFMGAEWQRLFGVVVKEAARLGLEVNMNNDAGWNGSGGPWITPDKAMQKVVYTETDIDGGSDVHIKLPMPEVQHGYYKDIQVLAFPKRGNYRVADIAVKAAYVVSGANSPISNVPADSVIDADSIINLTSQMNSDGSVDWRAPAGRWTIMRFGHTCTGAVNGPAPATGTGLECDKLSTEGADANWNGMMAKLVAANKPYVGKSFVATHVDSWEVGSQNWTTKMPQMFKQHAGYDLTPYLPAFAGYVVNSAEQTERFLWDLRSAISWGVINNYAGRIRSLANASGLRFTIEAYGSPCDNLPYAKMANEPMGEFWIGAGAIESCRGMASAAHIYGKTIVGAESFTAGSDERWLQYPGSIKALGDRAFCEGINRFVFHRYAMQPWTNREPGMTMGPWGLHYERTNTWWNQSSAWHTYLARCQQMLRQGLYVADVCYLQAQTHFTGLPMYQLKGYSYDIVTPEAVINLMHVMNGRFVLPGGMSYRLMVLPDGNSMTSDLAAKIRKLVEQGGNVLGSLPSKSPSMADYKSDDAAMHTAVSTLAEYRVKKSSGGGRVLSGMSPEQALSALTATPDCQLFSGSSVNWIHRRISDGEMYFVANPLSSGQRVALNFRVKGMVPELWHPESGTTELASVYSSSSTGTTVCLSLLPQESVFVVFRKGTKPALKLASLSLGGKAVLSIPKATAKPTASNLVVLSAKYGVIGDPSKTIDVVGRVKTLLQQGAEQFQVAKLAEGGDPAFGVVKTAIITIKGKKGIYTVKGTDPENLNLADPNGEVTLDTTVQPVSSNGVKLTVWKNGKYEFTASNGAKAAVLVSKLPAAKVVAAPFKVQFQTQKGGPASITMQKLVPWNESQNAAVKYYSGSATYHFTIRMNAADLRADRCWMLDLGTVKVMAEVSVNGKSAGILWKAPYRKDISQWLKAGDNAVDVRVTNLWVNRQIGDELLPDDSERRGDGTLVRWPDWVDTNSPSPTGRISFTSWRLWNKNDQLQPSGLIGPVAVRPGYKTTVKFGTNKR